MGAEILDGVALASDIKKDLKTDIDALIREKNLTPSLKIFLVGDDEPSRIYVNKKKKWCSEVGITCAIKAFDGDVSYLELKKYIEEANKDPKVHGILVQLPLPPKFDQYEVINLVDPMKDVDGLTSFNQGSLAWKRSLFFPCTPMAVMELIEKFAPFDEKVIVLVGHGVLLGLPLSLMLSRLGGAILIIQKSTPNPEEIAKLGDILIVAAGVKHLVTKNWVKKGAVVVDVGIHKGKNGKGIFGDVDTEDILKVARAVTPVPGGVGPLTVAMLLKNCVAAAKLQYEHHEQK